MKCYISLDADGAGQLVGRARLADDEEALRKLSHALDAGNELFKKWAETCGGSLVEMGGDEACVEVPVSCLSQLPDMKSRYESLVGATLSIGVGLKISESSKALLAVKLTGKDAIKFYAEDVEQIIAQAQEKPESEKIVDEYLHPLEKAAPAMNPGAFSGASRPSAPTIDKPVMAQGEHSEGQVIRDYIDENQTSPEMTHAAKDFERQFHDEASKGDVEDGQTAQAQASKADQVRTQIAQALQAIKAQMPVFEQIRGVAPEAYQAMVALASAVVGMGREMSPAQPMAKAEKSGANLVHYGVKPGLKRIDVKHMGTGARAAEYRQGVPEVPRAYYYREGATPEPSVVQGAKSVYNVKLDPSHRLYDLGADPEGLSGPSRERFLAGEGLNSPEDTLLQAVKDRKYHGYFNSASALPDVVALFHPAAVGKEIKKEELKIEADPDKPVPEDSKLDKAKLPMPKASAHHHVILPVGSVKDDRVKVQHSDGRQGWVEVRSGQITSQDPSHHPVSSRNPSGK